MAIVYKAKDNVLNRFVAVKVMKEEFVSDEGFVKRFNSEAQAAAALSHPNIVSIYDVAHSDEEGIYYIVMELVKGKTLKQIINEDGKLPWKWSINIAIQICSALECAHKNGIIHRDIKPHNIMITEDGVAKVTDFGIAKAVSNSTITAFGSTIGSVHYFSPEHAKGGITDAKSDLYSLGVVMYEMLTGKVPFDADTPVSIALKHMQEEPVEPIKLNSRIPYGINEIIMKAMRKDPTERYQSADEMLEDLRQGLKDPDGDFVRENEEKNVKKRKKSVPGETGKAGSPSDYDDRDGRKNKLAVFFKTHPRAKIAAIAGTFFLVFLLILGLVMIGINVNSVKDVQVLNLINKNEDEVKKALEGTKFTYELKEGEYSETVEAGRVISQDPEYRDNYTVKENSVYKLVLSKGSENVTLEEYVGKSYVEAKAALEKLNIKVQEVQEFDSADPGNVFKMEPVAGTVVKVNDVVKLYVSKGTEKVQVTSVLNKDEGSATNILEGQKLKVHVDYKEDTTVTDGVVLSQNPTAGSTVDAGTTIYLVVNKIEPPTDLAVKVNVKAITGGYTETETSNTTNSHSSSTATSKSVIFKFKDSVTGRESSPTSAQDKNNGVVTIGSTKGKGTTTILLYGKEKANDDFTLYGQYSVEYSDGEVIIDSKN